MHLSTCIVHWRFLSKLITVNIWWVILGSSYSLKSWRINKIFIHSHALCPERSQAILRKIQSIFISVYAMMVHKGIHIFDAGTKRKSLMNVWEQNGKLAMIYIKYASIKHAVKLWLIKTPHSSVSVLLKFGSCLAKYPLFVTSWMADFQHPPYLFIS